MMSGRLLLIALLIFNSNADAFLFSKKESPEEKARLAEIKREITGSRKNADIYFGEAFAEVKKFNGDLWKTTEGARRRARQQLNEYIKIRVDSSLRQVLSVGKGGYKQEIDDITELYADKVLEEIQYRDYSDYPKKGLVTVMAFVSKEKYKQTVLNDMETKKAKIITHLRAALKALKAQLISQALDNFIQAKDWYEEYFHRAPLNMDIDKDGKMEELGALIEVYLSSILKSMEFRQKEKRYTYGLNGQMVEKPQVFVYYKDNGREIPLSHLAVKAKFVLGEGRLADIKLATDESGGVFIPVEYVNAEMGDSSIQIEPDLKISGLSVPFHRINLNKRKAAVYSAVFISGGKYSSPVSVENSIKTLLSRYGYDMQKLRVNKSEPLPGDIAEAAQTNADYYIFVAIVTSAAKQVADYDMYRAEVGSKIMVFDLNENRLLNSAAGPSAGGTGYSKSEASSNGLGKISRQLAALLEEEIKKW